MANDFHFLLRKFFSRERGMKKRIALFLVCLFVAQQIQCQWAHLFHKKILPDESARAARHNEFFFARFDIPKFSQLLLSWNAIRPSKGHFTFFVQARNARSKKWGSWHRMIEWGTNIQRSHATQSDGFSKYLHVRLETEPLQFADAFRIRVIGTDDASLSSLKSLALTTINMNEFKPESVAQDLSDLPSVFVRNVPKISQISLDHEDNHRMCSPVACTMLSRFFTKHVTNPVHFAHKCFDNGLDSYGSWPFNMAHIFENVQGKAWFFNTRLNSFKDLHRQLRRGIPALVSVRGTIQKAPRPYPQGHLLMVVGYDRKTQEVICHDPAKEGHLNVEQRYDLADFIHSWEASRRLTYWAERA